MDADFFDGINRAKVSKVTLLMRFAKTLHPHRRRILPYYDYPISTGPLEGETHNKTQKSWLFITPGTLVG